MPLTPVDITNKQFKQATFGGYRKVEVDEFLDQVVQEMERLIREHSRTQETVAQLEQRLQEYRKLEDTLNRTLVMAQETAESIRANARREAELIIQEARLEAERIAEAGRAEARRIQAEIAELQKLAEATRSHLRGMLLAQLELLERYGGTLPAQQAATAREPVQAK